MDLINKVVTVLMWASLAMFFLGSVGAFIHSLESRRMGWAFSFLCIPGATLLYVAMHKAETKPQWTLMKVGFYVLLGALALIAVLVVAAPSHA